MSALSAGTPRGGSWMALYGPLLPLLAICLVPLAFALTRTAAIERDMRIAVTENMLWVVSQTQMEMLNLAVTAMSPDQTEDDIAHRYDMVLSRLALLQDGPQRRYLAELGHDMTAGQIERELRRLDPIERGHSDELHDALSRLGLDLQPQLKRIATDVMTAEWTAAAERLDDYRSMQRTVALAVGSALVAALVISWLLLRNQRRLHRAEMMQVRANVMLERERNTSAWYKDFAALVSHEIRTPLTLIDSAMHRLLRKGEAVTAQDVAERHAVIHDAVLRLTRVVETVLMAGRVDDEAVESRLAPENFSALAEKAIDDAQRHYPDREIILSSSATGLLAQCDRHLVGHILGNLLSNALTYSPPDTPVELRVFAQGARVACAVGDRGPGIPPTEQDHVFERFYRGRDQMTKPGTGLGLALSRELASLQGGEVTMESWPGRGSLFTLWLPAAVRHDT